MLRGAASISEGIFLQEQDIGGKRQWLVVGWPIDPKKQRLTFQLWCNIIPFTTLCSPCFSHSVEFHFWLLAVSSRLWVWWNVCHNFFNFCIGKTFTSVSFYVHLQIVYTKKWFYAILHAHMHKSLSPVSSDHVHLQIVYTKKWFYAYAHILKAFLQ